MKPFWLVQEVCGARRLLRSSRKTSLVSDETIFQFARGVNIFQFNPVVAVARVSLGLRLKLQRLSEVRIDSGNSGAKAAGDFIG